MTEDEAAIRDLVASWMAASKRGDFAALLSLMTDDVVFMVPGREPFGQETFAKAAQAQAGIEMDGRADIVEVHVLGEWAFMRTSIELTVTQPHVRPFRRSGYTLTLLRKGSDGQWRIARDANLLGPNE